MIADVGGPRHNASGYLNYRKTRAWYRRWRRRSRGGRRWAGCRCRCWRRQWNVSSGLNTNKRWRAGLKVAYHRICWVGRLIGVEPEVIQRAEANCIGVLILRKRFRAPGDRACVLGNTPRSAAISLAVKSAIICKGGMLRRRMKADVRDVYSWPNRHAERLDRAVEVLVIESVFIVPHARTGVRYFETHEPDTIIAVIRFDLIYCRAAPGHDRWLLAHRGSCASKTEGLVNPGYGVRTVRSIVIHVALVGMTLAPGAFVRHDVFGFGKIRRSLV
jgi:hypothetical protein